MMAFYRPYSFARGLNGPLFNNQLVFSKLLMASVVHDIFSQACDFLQDPELLLLPPASEICSAAPAPL